MPARRVAAFALLAATAGLTQAFATEPAGSVALDCSDTGQTLAIPASGVLEIRAAATQPAWLEVIERGHLVVPSIANADAGISIGVPYRYGRHRVRVDPAQPLRIERKPPVSRASASVEVRLHCGDTPDKARDREWLASLAAITRRLDKLLASADTDALLEAIKAPLASATTPTQAALARHARAQILLLGDRTADAAEAFAEVEQAWADAADPARARVARVAHSEALLRLARHEEAFQLTADVSAQEARQSYFAARLRLTGCLSMRYQGRMAEALPCFRAGVADMEKLDEIPDLISALQDMADVSRFLGDRASARALGQRALGLATLPAMEGLRGRIQLMLADIALEQGDIGAALIGFDGALSEFAAGNERRWEANALLRTAELYLGLGALDEATDFVSAALTRLNERDAPTRVAVARLTQARIDLRRGLVDRAQRGVAAAIDTYTQRKMPAELDATQLVQARLFLQIGDRAGAAAVVARRNRSQALNRDSWRLLEASLSALQNRCGEALAILRELDSQPIAIERELERVQIRAECLAASGRFADAERLLAATAGQVAALAQRIDSPLLRPVLAAYIAPLRRSAFRHLARIEKGSPGDVATIWRWLHLDDATLGAPRAANAAASSRFDAEVARELLPPTAAPAPGARRETDAPRHLLTLLATPRGSSEGSGVAAIKATSLDEVQQRLGDAVLVSYVDAGADSQLLWISRDRVRLQPTADVSALRAEAEQLGASSSRRDASLSSIQADASRLAALLWPSAEDAGEPPRHLLVDASSPLASLPWSVLHWPGANAMLLETTAVTIARIGAEGAAPAASRPDVTVYIAGQENNPALPALWNARAEPGLVERGVKAGGGTVRSVAATDRDGFIAAFSQRKPWLHVAAHGGTLPSRIGYAGLWLESSAEQPTRFVSWLEILARGSSNELVVLNACQLAEAQQAPVAGLSFADAVSRAGARDVVAARWQVSDGATTLWVPVFYAAMSEGGGAADALWQAQRRLRESRVYRHPFYWASYVHYGRL